MEAYEIDNNLYRIPGGYGNSGEVYGGLLINDDPTIVIGASGGRKFLRNLIEIINELQLSKSFRLYLTSTTFEEIDTLEHIQDHFPEATFYIHQDIANIVKSPRKEFMIDRFGKYNEKHIKSVSRRLPKKLENIVEISKMSTFKAKNTKIMIIPFGGPHRGHTFIYSTAQKLLCTGLVGGYSSTDKRLYYLDFTGSVKNYKNAFSFLKQAEADIIFPAYEEPHFTKTGGISTIEVETALERDKESIYELCTLKPKTIDELLDEFRRYYGFNIYTEPYDQIKLDATLIEFNLKLLIEEGKVLTKDNTYRRA